MPLAENTDRQVLLVWRVPRVLCAALAGAGLAAAGVAFQAVLRNPLATPFTLGVSAGGALGAVLGIRLGLASSLGPYAIPACAFLGASSVMALVYRLAKGAHGVPVNTLLLAGVTMSFVCGACTMFIQYTADYAQSYRIVHWMMGGLYGVRTGDVWLIGPPLLLGVTILGLHARDLNALCAGELAAASVGVDVTRSLRWTYFAASLIVGSVVAVAGPIGLVGLIVPHALRRLVGPDHRVLLPASVFGGAAFLVWCDTLGRTVFPPEGIPVGVLTAMLGGPFFLWLLLRQRGRGNVWG